ncbi:MAG: 3-hydroxyacyl-ACP dehydratase FabZ family protein [Bacteriovoracaceae bacterium]
MDEIQEGLKQRPPFLFVDEIVERGAQHIHTRKYVKADEYYFKGHFPGNPIMPGVLLQECAFQSGSLILVNEKAGNKTGVVSRVSDVKFRSLVRPGDVIDIKVELKEELSGAYFFEARLFVENKRVCQLNFTCNLVEN